MITNRIFQTATLVSLFVLPVRASEKSIPVQKVEDTADYVDKDGTIVLHGSIAAIPNIASSFEAWKKCAYISTGSNLAHTFPQMQEKDVTSQFSYSSITCRDWESHWHPLPLTVMTDHLPSLLPIAYKSPSPHPYFIKKTVEENLTELPRPLRTIISDYAANPSMLLDCTEGDTIQILLPNLANKKVIAQLTCIQSYGDPFRIQLARGLVKNDQISPQLKAQLSKLIEAHERQKLKSLDLAAQWLTFGPF
jgi:hypothetical protein